MRHLIVPSLVSLAVVAGCSDDDGDGGSTSVERRIGAAYCDYLQRCYPYDSGENTFILMLRGASDAQCADFMRQLLFDGHIDAGVADGSLIVDDAKLDACIEALGSQCVDSPELLCIGAVEGKVAVGGSCVASEDCAGDAYCSLEDCDRKCIASRAPGEECSYDAQCSQATGPHGCGEDSATCLPRRATNDVAAEGEACGAVERDNEIALVSCGAGFGCESGHCQKIGAVGSACENDHSPCALGNVCIESNGEADTGTCQALPLVSQVGGACNEDFEGGSPVVCNWAIGLGCRGGKCVAQGDGTVGATCFAEHGSSIDACDAGNYCGADDKCAVKKDAGADCEDSNECKTDYCDGTCKPLVCE